MRIVQVTLRFDAPGGVETTVRELSGRLRAAGDDVEVFAGDLIDESGWVRGTAFRPVVDGVPVRRFRSLKRSVLPRSPLPMLVGLSDALGESRADIVHAHSHRYGHVLQAAAVARRRGWPLVVSPHYHPADRRETALQRGMLRVEDFVFGAAAYRSAAAIVVESALEAELVADFAPRERIHIIPPGIDTARWAADGAGARPLGLPERYVLFVGRLASNKGLPGLLAALARSSPSERRPLALLGPDWGMRAELEALARHLGVSDQLIWLNRIDDDPTYRAIVRGAEALVLPSEWEAYGLVLLDALAAGTPVVATAVGGVPELLDGGRCGRLVPYGDPSALAEALRNVRIDRTTTARLVHAGTERARSLDWSESVRRHRALYAMVARA